MPFNAPECRDNYSHCSFYHGKRTWYVFSLKFLLKCPVLLQFARLVFSEKNLWFLQYLCKTWQIVALVSSIFVVKMRVFTTKGFLCIIVPWNEGGFQHKKCRFSSADGNRNYALLFYFYFINYIFGSIVIFSIKSAGYG